MGALLGGPRPRRRSRPELAEPRDGDSRTLSLTTFWGESSVVKQTKLSQPALVRVKGDITSEVILI